MQSQFQGHDGIIELERSEAFEIFGVSGEPIYNSFTSSLKYRVSFSIQLGILLI
jgi:hypothetical protein